MTMNKFSRVFSMPSADTFSMGPVASFIERNINRQGFVVDPFARNSTLADIRNDLNPNTIAEFHMDAVDFLASLASRDDITTVLFDPPYSPRQISECYAAAGLTATMKDTQNARFYRECREAISAFLPVGGVVMSFGWNSLGMGRHWTRVETMLVYHGGAHNDTICVADRQNGEGYAKRERLRSNAGERGAGGGTVDVGPRDGHPEGVSEETGVPSGGRGEGAQERGADRVTVEADAAPSVFD